MDSQDITVLSIVTWCLTTAIYGVLKKWDGYNPDYKIPFGSVTLGDFIGSVIAIVSGIIVTVIAYYTGQTQTDFSTIIKEGLIAIIGAVGFHGLFGTHIAKALEKKVIGVDK